MGRRESGKKKGTREGRKERGRQPVTCCAKKSETLCFPRYEELMMLKE